MDSRDGASRADDPHNPLNNRGIDAITVATNFTAAANAAVRRAARICHENHARMHVVHVISPNRAKADLALGALSPRGKRLSASDAVAKLRQEAARVIAEFGVHVETHLGIGNVSREIGKIARATAADIVVVGNSRRNLLAELLGMNTALRVHRRTNLPLLAVSNAVLRRYSCLLLPSDLSSEAARAGQQALRFFPSSTFVVLHAFESPYTGMLSMSSVSLEVLADYRRRAKAEGLERLRRFARDASIEGKAILQVELGHPAISARARVREMDVDLVVLRPSRRWLSSGVTEHLVADPPCDLLLMP